MKKLNLFFFVAFLGVFLSFVDCSFASVAETENKNPIDTLKETKNKILSYTKNCPQLSELINKGFPIAEKITLLENNKTLNEAQKKELFLNMVKQFELDPSFVALENLPLKKDDCSTYTVMFRDLVYSMSESTKKLKNLHDELIKIADNNFPAQNLLCNFGEDSKSIDTKINEQIGYCEEAINNKNKPQYLTDEEFKSTKELLYNALSNKYYQTKQIKKLLNTCEKMDGSWAQEFCYKNLGYLADDSLSPDINIYYQKVITYWETVYSQTDSITDKKSKNETAAYELESLYVKTKQTKQLITFCENIKDKEAQENCGLQEQILGDKFYELKQFNMALPLYQAAAQYNKYGFSARERLANMYFEGEGVPIDAYEAIRWYEKALKLSYSSTVIGNIGAAYYKLNDYRMAFKYYYNAATQGNAWFQANIANMYAKGQGVIQDNMQAYAWVNVALTQGFEDKQKQFYCEKLRENLENILKQESKYGKKLDEARVLAKKYYKLYVLHEKKEKIAERGLKARVLSALSELTK
jgi:TPR repeat protein